MQLRLLLQRGSKHYSSNGVRSSLLLLHSSSSNVSWLRRNRTC